MDKHDYRPIRHDHTEFLKRASEREGFKEAYDASEDPYQLARKLLAARTRAGVTQQEVAAAMGTTRSAVSRLESPGKHSPSVKTLIKYARAVGCDIEIGLVPRPPKKKEARPADTRQKRAAGS